ncbi:lipopolysaccharide assembly protein LapB [Pseudomonadales bacterium]|nr:lipopolysaccharide assembly protein LapB [Pseudomonadales bacterium]
MDNLLLYLLIFLAIAAGWWSGRRDRRKVPPTVSANYFTGLNYLLNEEPDRAVSTFVEELEVNGDTLETHLALGNLLRRRGEIDKAIVVHKNILKNNIITPDDSRLVQLELARDYLLAGLLDRSEELLMDMIAKSGPLKNESRKLLLEIFEQGKEWRKAIEIAEMLASGTETEHFEEAISQYHCELAEEYLGSNRFDDARSALSDAMGHDARNARVSLLVGNLEFKHGNYQEAIRSLVRIKDQRAIYVPESLELLARSYEASGADPQALHDYLKACLEIIPSISIVLFLAERIREEFGDEAVAKFIADHLKRNPTIRGLSQLIDLHIDNTQGVAKENLAILRSFTEALVAGKPAYQCKSCGFEGKVLRWSCPSCKSWGKTEPIFGLEGE